MPKKNQMNKPLLLLPFILPIFDASASLTMTGCNPYCSESNYGFYPHEFDQYTINADQTTPSGIKYDASGLFISGDLIDHLTDNVISCLTKAFPDGKLPDSVVSNSICYGNSFHVPLDRTSFKVKIANDCVYSCSSPDEEVLPTPVKAGNAGCEAKQKTGQIPTQCYNEPCRWRGGISCPNTIITCSTFSVYKDDLVRWFTSCADPWGSPELAVCASAQ